MESYNVVNIIGGGYENKGCLFDDIATLVDSYLSLLIEALTNGGIVYSTGRNAILARIEMDVDKGFVNYVQPAICKWNYTDPKYQRSVSPEFVIFMFNNTCLRHSFQLAQARNETYGTEMKFNSKNQSIDGTFFQELNMETILEKHKAYQEEWFKKQIGEPNKYDMLNPNTIKVVELLYKLIESVINHSKNFSNYQKALEEFNNLNMGLENGSIDYNSLSSEQQEFIEYFDYEDDKYRMNLGCFNNSIRKEVEKYLISIQKKKNRLLKKGMDVSSIDNYDDPISIIDGDCLDFDSYGDDLDCSIIVDYSNAKEFTSSRQNSHSEILPFKRK